MAIRTLPAPTRPMYTHSDDEMAIADIAFDQVGNIKAVLTAAARGTSREDLAIAQAVQIEAMTEAAAQKMYADFIGVYGINPTDSFRVLAERRMQEMLDEAIT